LDETANFTIAMFAAPFVKDQQKEDLPKMAIITSPLNTSTVPRMTKYK